MDIEARARADHTKELRLWLRLLTCSQLIEKHVRAGLRNSFNTTLPRFDLMAQLEKSTEGIKMSELSRRMMVTGGNVTAITDQLVQEGLVERLEVPGDRRAYRVRLTTSGRENFEQMATEHEQWIGQCFAGLDKANMDQLYHLLGQVKQQTLQVNA